jgi:hypothetical protein
MNFDLSGLIRKPVFTRDEELRILIVTEALRRYEQVRVPSADGAAGAEGAISPRRAAVIAKIQRLRRLRTDTNITAQARGHGYRSPDNQCLAVIHHRREAPIGVVTRTWGVPLCNDCNKWLEKSVVFKGPGTLRDRRTTELCSLVL